MTASYSSAVDTADLIHGELLEVFSLGVLITGASGTGKSELALELISRGHRLIADDAPALFRLGDDIIEGYCPPHLQGFLEVRGLGVLNIRRLFGDGAITLNKQVQLIIHLVRAGEGSSADEFRLQGTRRYRRILAVDIPEISLPIAPGRNLAVLVECAARDYLQRLQGYRADQELAERLHREIARRSPCA